MRITPPKKASISADLSLGRLVTQTLIPVWVSSDMELNPTQQFPPDLKPSPRSTEHTRHPHQPCRCCECEPLVLRLPYPHCEPQSL